MIQVDRIFTSNLNKADEMYFKTLARPKQENTTESKTFWHGMTQLTLSWTDEKRQTDVTHTRSIDTTILMPQMPFEFSEFKIEFSLVSYFFKFLSAILHKDDEVTLHIDVYKLDFNGESYSINPSVWIRNNKTAYTVPLHSIYLTKLQLDAWITFA